MDDRINNISDIKLNSFIVVGAIGVAAILIADFFSKGVGLLISKLYVINL